MTLRLFWEDKKGYVEVIDKVVEINILTVEPRKKALEVVTEDNKPEIILFNEIKLAFLRDIDSGREYFRMCN